MGFDKKTKVKFGLIIIILLGAIFFLLINYNQTIEILYFTNPKCRLVNETDVIIQEIENDFKDKVNVRTIKVSMYPDDEPDTEEIKRLREKYEVYGVPTIIINGEEFTEEFTKENLRENICNYFMIKPKVC